VAPELPVRVVVDAAAGELREDHSESIKNCFQYYALNIALKV
jgi:hypothetical protein